MGKSGWAIKFDKKQREKMEELLAGPEPQTQLEKDIFNLKCMRYSIKFGSRDFRSGMIKTLDRSIAALELVYK